MSYFRDRKAHELSLGDVVFHELRARKVATIRYRKGDGVVFVSFEDAPTVECELEAGRNVRVKVRS